MKTALLLAIAFFISAVPVDATCISAENYYNSAVSIKIYKDGKPFQGSAWFYKDSKTLVTAGHFARILPDDPPAWSKIEILQQRKGRKIFKRQNVRIMRIGNIRDASIRELGFMEKYAREDLGILELESPFLDALPLDVAPHKVEPYYPLRILAYPYGKLTPARARSLPPGLDEKFFGRFESLLHIEILNQRNIAGAGASGSPVLNCEGKVAGTITAQLSDVFVNPQRLWVIRPAYGSATNYAVPSSFLTELLRRK